MSAFVVNKKHLDAMLTWGLRYKELGPLFWRKRKLTYETANEVGQMLWDQNYASVNCRYNTNEKPPEYIFSRYEGALTPGKMLAAIDCYKYQACENREWEKSEALDFCQALAGDVISKIPGYEGAWEIEE